MPKPREYLPLHVALITVSNRHTPATDSTGSLLATQLQDVGHLLHSQLIVAENKYLIRAVVSALIADSSCHAVILSGGTGFQAKNCTSEAIQVLFDRHIDGFAELFRQLSYSGTQRHAAVCSAAMQSDALAGLANQTAVFAIPGSPDAASLAATELIWPQLDARTLPCNFAHLLLQQSCPSQYKPTEAKGVC
jgi:molybdenum cofactor biosynthesis protein B